MAGNSHYRRIEKRPEQIANFLLMDGVTQADSAWYQPT